MTFRNALEVNCRRSVVFMVAVCLYAVPAPAQDVVSPSVLSALEWRLIGPYRGGRVTTVTGVADDPML